MSIGTPSDNKAFFSPSADGKIVHKITEEEYERRSANPNDNVRKRDWIDRDGNKGSSFEETYRELVGMITEIGFREHPQYGKSINTTLVNTEGDAGVFSVKTDSKFGMSYLEVLPNVNLDEEVKIKAWAKQDGEKRKQAIFITQNDGKEDKSVESFYRKWDDKKKEWKLSNGYPEVDEEKLKKFGDKKYWTTQYFPEVEVHLCEKVEELVMPKVTAYVPADDSEEPASPPAEEIDADEVEF